MRRAQISTEFLFIMGFATLILLAYLFVTLYVQQDAIADEQQASAERIAAQIRQELITASVVLDGYSRTFVIPTHVRNRPVAIEARPQAIVVTVGDQQAYARTTDYVGVPRTGSNTLVKQNGEVRFV